MKDKSIFKAVKELREYRFIESMNGDLYDVYDIDSGIHISKIKLKERESNESLYERFLNQIDFS